jgi:ATP-binding cassette subfamily B protein
MTGLFLLGLLSIPLALLTPLPLKIVIDNVIGSKPLPALLRNVVPGSAQHSASSLLIIAAAMTIAVALLVQTQGLLNWLLQTYAGEGMVHDFRLRLFDHVQRLSLTYHDAKGTADSTFRIQYDAPALQYIAITGLIPLLTSLATLAGMILVTARLDWELALVALGISPVLFLLTRTFGARLHARWTDVKMLESSANSLVQEVLSSVRVVKAFGREQREQARFTHHSIGRMRELIRVSFLQGGFDLATGMTLATGTAITLYVGVLHVQNGRLSLGDLVLVLAYVAQLYQPLQALSKKLTDIQASLISAERAFAVLDQSPDVAERPNARALKRANGDVAFDNVSFSYNPNHPVLTGVSLKIPSGARIGIQGKTGTGKSTLMSLLVRFFDVTSGQILLDGVDIRDYKLADLRDQFAIVQQDSVLFSTTIAENIGYGVEESTPEKIVEAAKLANAHDFIASLPQGYETQVGERGMSLSGGERQRIALARAFLKDAPLLILDEPTSAVDTRTEAAIIEALERLMQGRTTFMIAHRLSTLESCDMRLEIADGQVRTAPTLLQTGGAA